MARADLLVGLVQSGLNGDRTRFRKTVEAVAAEERSRHHTILAERLGALLHVTPFEPGRPNGPLPVDAGLVNLVREVVPQRKLSDLVLPQAVRQICKELLEEHHRRDLLRSYGLEPRNRVLLIGPPGNGKTSLAEAMAEALMLPMYIVRYEGVIGTYLGETANRLRRLMDHACSRNCVLFFDEFETLGKERGDIHETGEIKRVVSSLLMQIDALPSHVMVIGATNHPELLDRASWRRFHIRMRLPKPTRAGLTEWFGLFAQRMKMPLGVAAETLAKRLLGCNFSDAEEFGTTVFRRFVLEQPNADVRAIVARTLKEWPYRAVGATRQEDGGK
jgi:SpoVK/Ycf46/Vps4 family AAA+-type ATPase